MQRISRIRDAAGGRCAERMSPDHHGDAPRWLAALDALPDVRPSDVRSAIPSASVRGGSDAVRAARSKRRCARLHPGARVRSSSSAAHRYGVALGLEVARSRARRRPRGAASSTSAPATVTTAGACCEPVPTFVLGVDPTILFNMQHRAASFYLPDSPHATCCCRCDSRNCRAGPEFDVAFSMGVIYHRKDPVRTHRAAAIHTLLPAAVSSSRR